MKDNGGNNLGETDEIRRLRPDRKSHDADVLNLSAIEAPQHV